MNNIKIGSHEIRFLFEILFNSLEVGEHESFTYTLETRRKMADNLIYKNLRAANKLNEKKDSE